MKFLAIAAVAAGLAVSGAANAAAITGLFNTGTDASDLALAGGDGVADPHYVITSSTAGGDIPRAAVTYFNSAYLANDATSRWISLSADGTPGNDLTTYELTFDLTGFDASSASLSGLWGVDNEVEMFLNGVSTGNKLTGDVPGVVDQGDFASFQALHAFTVNSGFQAGVNHLDFVVLDTGPPTALRVDSLTGTANLASVPEPATWAMMLMGFGGLGALLRQRRRIAATA